MLNNDLVGCTIVGKSDNLSGRFASRVRSVFASQLISMMSGFALASLITAMASALVIPLYTRVLTPSEYGTVDVVQTLILIVAAISTLGVEHTLPALYHTYDYSIAKDKLVKTSIASISLASAGVAIVVGLTSPVLANILLHNHNLWPLILIGCASIWLLPIQSVVMTVLRLQLRPKLYVLISAIGTVTMLLSALIVVVVLNVGPAGVLTSTAVGTFAVVLAGTISLKSSLRSQLDRVIASKMFQLGVRVMPASLLWILLLSLDRLILVRFVPTSELGIYTVANKVANFVLLFSMALFGAWIPVILKRLSDTKNSGNVGPLSEIILVLLLTGVVGVGLYSKDIISLAAPVYTDSARLIPLLLIFNGPSIAVYSTLSLAAYTSGKVQYITIATAAALVTNIVANLITIPLLGIQGAANATALSGLVLMSTMWLLTRRERPVRIMVMPLGVLAIGYLFVIYNLNIEPGVLVVKALALITFPLTACAFLFVLRAHLVTTKSKS